MSFPLLKTHGGAQGFPRPGLPGKVAQPSPSTSLALHPTLPLGCHLGATFCLFPSRACFFAALPIYLGLARRLQGPV